MRAWSSQTVSSSTEWLPFSDGIFAFSQLVANWGMATAKGQGTIPNNFAQRETAEMASQHYKSNRTYIGTLLYAHWPRSTLRKLKKNLPQMD